MDIGKRILSSVVTEAQKYLSKCSRSGDTPIRFDLHIIPKDNSAITKLPLIADVPNPPAWGWPVLSTADSIKTLQAALEQVEFTPKSILVAASCDGNPYHVIWDLFGEDKTINPDVFSNSVSNLQILRRDEIAEAIKAESDIASDTRVAMAVSVDTSISLELGAHQRYSMDGSGTILWLGTIIDNYPTPSPEDIDVAVNKEIMYADGRCDTVLIVSGDVVDAGDGRALIKSPHHIDSAIVD